MTYPFTIENNRTIAVRTHVGLNLSRFICAGFDSLVVKLTAIDGGFIRRRLYKWLDMGLGVPAPQTPFWIFFFF